MAEDLKNLAATSRVLHNDIHGHDIQFESLLAAALCCDGGSGDQWTSDWMAAIEDRGQVDKRFERLTSLRKLPSADQQAVWQRHEDVIDRTACQSETIGPAASKRCRLCSEPVCNVSHEQSLASLLTRLTDRVTIGLPLPQQLRHRVTP